jgi:hypothetical protein
VSLICLLCFIFRAILLPVLSSFFGGDYHYWFTIVLYLAVAELLPMLLMMKIFDASGAGVPTQRHSGAAAPPDDSSARKKTQERTASAAADNAAAARRRVKYRESGDDLDKLRAELLRSEDDTAPAEFVSIVYPNSAAQPPLPAATKPLLSDHIINSYCATDGSAAVGGASGASVSGAAPVPAGASMRSAALLPPLAPDGDSDNRILSFLVDPDASQPAFVPSSATHSHSHGHAGAGAAAGAASSMHKSPSKGKLASMAQQAAAAVPHTSLRPVALFPHAHSVISAPSLRSPHGAANVGSFGSAGSAGSGLGLRTSDSRSSATSPTLSSPSVFQPPLGSESDFHLMHTAHGHHSARTLSSPTAATTQQHAYAFDNAPHTASALQPNSSGAHPIASGSAHERN